MQNLGRISPCERDIWPRASGNYTEQIVKIGRATEQDVLPAPPEEENYPPSRAAEGFSSLRSTFFTISVSLVWVGAFTPI